MSRPRFGGGPALAPIYKNGNDMLLETHIQNFLVAKSSKAYKTLLFYQVPLYQYRDSVGPQFWPPTPESINAFLAAAQKRGLKESSVRGYYKALKTWLDWLHKRGKLTSNPIALVERPPAPKLLPRVPQQIDLQKLFNYLRDAAKGGHWLDVRGLALWSLALDTGLRVSELAALTISDLPKDDRRVFFIKGQKTHQDRIVFFSKRTARSINRWLKARAGLPLPPGLDALFVSLHGRTNQPSPWRALTPWGMRQDLTHCCLKASIDPLNPHTMRHGYAVYTLRNGGNISDIQRQLGHSNVATTSRYLMVDDSGRGERHDQHSPFGNRGGDL